MTARVIAWDGVFTQEGLPQIALTHTPTLPGASHDWAADTLGAGGVAAWPALAGGTAFIADGAAPVLMEEGRGKLLRFDGRTSRMKASTPMTGAHTIIAVYRFRAPNQNSLVHFGLSGIGVGAVLTSGDGATINAAGGGRFIVPNPYISPDTAWHVVALTIDGAASALRHDDFEVPGNIPAGSRDGVTLGFADGGAGRTAIDYKRVAIIPGSMDSATRAGLVAYLKDRYGV